METKRKASNILEENINLLNKIIADEEDKNFITSMLMLEIEKFIKDPNKKNRLKDVLHMKLKIIQEIYEDRIEKGKLKQKEIDSIETAKRMIKMNFNTKDIIKVARISEEKLQTLL